MSLPEPLRPVTGEMGLVTDLPDLARRVVRAWDLFVPIAESVDLSGPTRSRGNSARDLLIPLGAWPDARGLHGMVADAHAGVHEVESESSAEKRLRAAHRDATDDEVRTALRTAREHLRAWVTGPDLATEAPLVTASPLGPVPIGTMVHAAAFQLAVIARDLRPAGADESPELDALAVVSLVDSSGAVAARLDATASIAAVTPAVSAGVGALPGAWRTVVTTDGDALGPAVLGPAGLLVDIAAGRVDLLELVRRLRLRDGRGLVGMSVVLDGIPDLPAAGLLGRVGGLLRRGRFPG
ncbi:MAG: hypothetical protein U0R64_00280 [Candidatus Nanopelagicales bacterium]